MEKNIQMLVIFKSGNLLHNINIWRWCLSPVTGFNHLSVCALKYIMQKVMTVKFQPYQPILVLNNILHFFSVFWLLNQTSSANKEPIVWQTWKKSSFKSTPRVKDFCNAANWQHVHTSPAQKWQQTFFKHSFSFSHCNPRACAFQFRACIMKPLPTIFSIALAGGQYLEPY